MLCFVAFNILVALFIYYTAVSENTLDLEMKTNLLLQQIKYLLLDCFLHTRFSVLTLNIINNEHLNNKDNIFLLFKMVMHILRCH